jgi:hypothetical protein
MKTNPVRKNSWFPCAFVLLVVLAEVGAWTVSSTLGFRNDPFLVGILATGLVAAMASVLYEGEDLG